MSQDEQGDTVPLSVRVPQALMSRVMTAGAEARCRHKTQAVIHVLEMGLEYLDRQKAKPLRLEKMVGRVEDLAATQLAILMEVLLNPKDKDQQEAIAVRREEIIREL
jgi:hypothetical protein